MTYEEILILFLRESHNDHLSGDSADSERFSDQFLSDAEMLAG